MNFETLNNLVVQWGKDRGLYTGNVAKQQLKKLDEEVQELKNAVEAHDEREIFDAIGDIMVVISHIAEFICTDLKTCYLLAYSEIKDRKGRMENGVFVKEQKES